MFERLHYTELKREISQKDIEFKSINDSNEFIALDGQKNAIDAINMGLNMDECNIFICGEKGLGKTNAIIKILNRKIKCEDITKDICYVYNFKNPKQGKKLIIPKGIGKSLKKDMLDLVNILKLEFNKLLLIDSYKSKRNNIINFYEDKKNNIIESIKKEALESNFSFETTEQGIYFVPLINDSSMSEEEFLLLPDNKKEEIKNKTDILENKTNITIKALEAFEKSLETDLKSFENDEFLRILNYRIGILINKYINENNIANYLLEVKEDIFANIDLFLETEMDNLNDNISPLSSSNNNQFSYRYNINLLVDNSKLIGKPIIIGKNIDYHDLLGYHQYDNDYKNIYTNYMNIHPGLLHKANGGYLILYAEDILTKDYLWDVLYSALLTKKIEIRLFNEHSIKMTSNLFLSEPISLDLKIIIIGSDFQYDLLCSYAQDFTDFFKIKTDFLSEVDFNNNNIASIKKYINDLLKNKFNNIKIDDCGFIKILEYSQKIVESQKKLSANLNIIDNIIYESSHYLKKSQSNIINKDIVSKVINNRINRNSSYEKTILNKISNEDIMITVTGDRVGQVNGLVVIEEDNYSFGLPAKITATTFMGENSIINIENESNLSGDIHNKGVHILTGYIGNIYSQEFPVAFTGQIAFEQNYSYIDGDSASCAELYVILSSLSDVPISQEIAVTGSINQFGELQSIGCVSEKIEGFYNVCKKKGFTKNQGVIIPFQNKVNLLLKKEVIDSVKNNEFHIYTINNISQGMEILTGKVFGVRDENNKYPKDSINYNIIKKLKYYNDNMNKNS